MATKLNMIQAAQNKRTLQEKQAENINANLVECAKQAGVDLSVIQENVTHVLANLAHATQRGDEFKLMHTNSISAFLAGVEAIAQALPQANNDERKANTLRVLQQAQVDPDGHMNQAVVPIAQLGARKEALREKYRKLVSDYVEGTSRGTPQGSGLSDAIRKLQMMIDRAVTISTPKQNEPARAGQSMTGSSPASL